MASVTTKETDGDFQLLEAADARPPDAINGDADDHDQEAGGAFRRLDDDEDDGEEGGRSSPIDKFDDEIPSKKEIEDAYEGLENPDNTPSTVIFLFFIFVVCLSQFFRAFESGFTASLMQNIKEDLELDYTDEGTVAASPDYGLSPGAIIAIWTYRHYRPKQVLTGLMYGIALSSFAVALFPALGTLVAVRAVNGALWAHAAVFYPIWVDRHGPTKHTRTVWMAWMNASVLIGVLFGFAMGGIARSNGDRVTWTHMYWIEGAMMAICGTVLLFGFDKNVMRSDGPYRPPELQHADSLQVVDASRHSRHNDDSPPLGSQISVWELLKSLVHHPSYVLAVLIVGCVAGGVTFALFFVSQVLEEKGLDDIQGTVYVLSVFITAPVPGMLLGSYIVGHLGGYTNHMASFGLSFVTASFVLIAAFLMPASELFQNSDGVASHLFLFANWLWFFAGSMPGTPLYGVAVSVLPRASFVASALQFAIANLAKVVVPQIGGIVCDRLGLLRGYYQTIIWTSATFLILSFFGVGYVIKQRGGLFHPNTFSMKEIDVA